MHEWMVTLGSEHYEHVGVHTAHPLRWLCLEKCVQIPLLNLDQNIVTISHIDTILITTTNKQIS